MKKKKGRFFKSRRLLHYVDKSQFYNVRNHLETRPQLVLVTLVFSYSELLLPTLSYCPGIGKM